MQNPTVEIAVQRGTKEVQRKYQNKNVYLDNGTEFMLCVHNPTQNVVGAKIILNGNNNDAMLVLRPGERVWLDRVLDSQYRMKFDTYEVDDSFNTKNAIKNNGCIKVEFYNEYIVSTIQDIFIGIPTRIKYVPYYVPYEWPYPYWYGFGGGTTSGNVLYSSSSPIGDASGGHSDSNNQNIFIGHNAMQDAKTLDNTCFNNTLETGRVEKGAESSQNFKNAEYNFETFAFHTINLQILPMSQKPIVVSDMKLYCAQCKRRQRKGDIFCPKCGTEYVS